MPTKRKGKHHSFAVTITFAANNELTALQRGELKDVVQDIADDVVGTTGTLRRATQDKIDRADVVVGNKRAICLPYTIDQNEPSRPLPLVIEIPRDNQERDQLLKELFIEHVCEDAEASDIFITKAKNDNDYGDIIVSYEDSMFLFVTLIKEG